MKMLENWSGKRLKKQRKYFMVSWQSNKIKINHAPDRGIEQQPRMTVARSSSLGGCQD
jgi:hypothetical protein